MYRHSTQHIDFITSFVDSVTVRPFFEDLRRVKQYDMRQAPRTARFDHETSTEAA